MLQNANPSLPHTFLTSIPRSGFACALHQHTDFPSVRRAQGFLVGVHAFLEGVRVGVEAGVRDLLAAHCLDAVTLCVTCSEHAAVLDGVADCV